jgi:hypothetical protein
MTLVQNKLFEEIAIQKAISTDKHPAEGALSNKVIESIRQVENEDFEDFETT